VSVPAWVLRAPFLTAVSIAVPWFAAFLVTGYRRHTRIVSCIAALISIVASAILLVQAPKGESLYQVLMVLFSCLTFGATLVLPRRDCTIGTISGILFLLGSTLLAYSTGNLLVLLAAWILSIIPFLWSGWFRARSRRPLVGLLLSSLALAIAILLISASTGVISINDLKGQSPGGAAAFGLLVIAVIFRKGICPAHAWELQSGRRSPRWCCLRPLRV
jgi:formate hydrogenlyase subunit 3/multisubunit Na+/H+ antiporter MnhD subunit